jgi:hypothetical protein
MRAAARLISARSAGLKSTGLVRSCDIYALNGCQQGSIQQYTAFSTVPKHANSNHSEEIHATCSESSCSCRCRKCGRKSESCSLFCQNENCQAIQRIDPKNCNIFQLFGLPTAYKLNSTDVEKAFKKLQWQLHPDKFSVKPIDDQQISTFNSSVVNDAYATLKDPVERAHCLVRVNLYSRMIELK